MLLIGLSGKKQSGKDTVASIIQQLAGSAYIYQRLAFADALYKEVGRMLLSDRGNTWATPKMVDAEIARIKSDKSKYRTLLQWWGTEYKRSRDPDYWIKKWLFELEMFRDDSMLVACTDVRFTNEYDTIKRCGGYVWRINRSAILQDFHQSEIDLDNKEFDIEIHNNGTLDDLKDRVKIALQLTIQKHNSKHTK